jgi:hypothetical protein
MKEIKDLLPQEIETFAHHTLKRVVAEGGVEIWRMLNPQRGRDCLVEVIISDLGIIIHGDIHPTSHPIIARKDLPWFVSNLGADSLSQHFLEKQYTPQAAREHVEDCIASLRTDLESTLDLGRRGSHPDIEKETRKLTDIIDDLNERLDMALNYGGDGLDSAHEFGERFGPILERYATDVEWVYPSLGYRPEDVARLVAIHQRFRVLYREAVGRRPAG